MSMDNFSTLVASLSGSNVVLSWTGFGSIGPVTNVAVQRASFGLTDWTTIQASAGTSLPGTYTDTAPEAGEYAYRLAVTVTRGGIDNAGTLLYSNQVNISTLATTGAVTLTGSVNASPDGSGGSIQGYSQVSLSWSIDNAGVNDDPISVEILRSLDGGTTFRHAGKVAQFGPASFAELIPSGTGSVQYKVVVSLPPNLANQLNTPKQSTSNVVTLTV